VVLGSNAALIKADLIAGVLFRHQTDLLKLRQKTIKHQHDLSILEQRLKGAPPRPPPPPPPPPLCALPRCAVLRCAPQHLTALVADGIVCEFVADKNLLGLVIGANGKNVDRVQHAVPDLVNIRVNSKTGTVTIVGKTQEAVNAARAQLEYVEEKYSIPRVHFGRVVGKKFQNIRDLEVWAPIRPAAHPPPTATALSSHPSIHPSIHPSFQLALPLS
jgi:hypothetical protein